MSAYFRYFMATFPLVHRMRLWMQWRTESSILTLPGQNIKHGVYVDSILSTQCIHLIFMDVMQFIYSTVFLSFFISSQHTKRISYILGFSSIAISYIFLNWCDCGRKVLLNGDPAQLYNVCKHGKGDHWAAARQKRALSITIHKQPMNTLKGCLTEKHLLAALFLTVWQL